ncbi:hypothetical protein GOP47_0009431 [Adiantum capillus-veneris]|uniref:beta-glucosidase n=1 Tax=Adiantum capillus-veneris TaxID=13818 RepID=A0A9D4ZJM9_ADICA|nr:hypothetical protein GOP47_0009431 [Adiantum capillus-veneris]
MAWASFLQCVVLLLLCVHAAMASSDVPLYKNPEAAVEARVKDLLSRMTLEEKIGQMMQIERSVANASTIQTNFIGSILSGGGSVPKEQASPTDWMDMVDGFQKAALSTRLCIPLMYGIDAVHGHNNVYGATIFPHNVGLGCTRDPDLVRRIGEATALEVRGTGIQYVFAPCIAVCRNPSWGRCYESYSEDPNLVRNMTEIIVGLQGKTTKPGSPFLAGQYNVAATAKHFVGDGGTNHGADERNTLSSYKSLVNIHMVGYFDAIAKGVSTIMVSYSSWNGQKMHSNRFLISHVLKKQLGFKGFVISDWQGIDKITIPAGINYTSSVELGVNAGIDMIMIPFDYPSFHADMLALVKSGHISMRRINDAVGRILRVKFTIGLFEHPLADRSLAKMVGAQDHRDLAREAVRKSLVLLKNERNGNAPFVPLSKRATKILVAGSHADDIGRQCGGWTTTWQGQSGGITPGTSVLEAIKSTIDTSTELVYEQLPDSNFAKGKGFDYAIVVVGEDPYAEFFGDDADLTLPNMGTQTIKNVCTLVKCVVVLVSGRPLVVEPYLPLMNGLVAAWLPGTEGKGIADVLFGDYPFEGKSSRTWFRRASQLPMNVNDQQYDPLFPYGFGLTTAAVVGDAASSRSSTLLFFFTLVLCFI